MSVRGQRGKLSKIAFLVTAIQKQGPQSYCTINHVMQQRQFTPLNVSVPLVSSAIAQEILQQIAGRLKRFDSHTTCRFVFGTNRLHQKRRLSLLLLHQTSFIQLPYRFHPLEYDSHSTGRHA